MNTEQKQEAVAILGKKAANKIKPPLSKKEIIEGMARALHQKRLEDYRKGQETLKKEEAEFNAAVLEVIFSKKRDFSIYSAYIDDSVIIKTQLESGTIQELTNKHKKTRDIFRREPQYSVALQEIREAQISQVPPRIQQLISDPKIQQKFLNMAEELLDSNQKTITV